MTFLSLNEIVQLQKILIESTGGESGIRDITLLESVVGCIHASFDGIDLYPTYIEKCVRLGHGIITNHPFIDGNKRIGIYVLIVCLDIEGITVNISNKDLVELGLSIAAGKFTYEQTLETILKYIKL